MSRVVFLLEERSIKALLDELLPRVVPGLRFLCVPHEGKADLERSVPRKIRAWREPGVRFVIVRDQNGCDCRVVKQRLLRLCQQAGRTDVLVRIVCRELEAWYLGEPAALADVYGDDGLRGIGRRARFRDPDTVVHPARALFGLAPEYQKISGGRRLGARLTREGNRSRSFQVLLDGLDRLASELSTGGPRSR